MLVFHDLRVSLEKRSFLATKHFRHIILRNCLFIVQLDIIITWPENLNHLASIVFEIIFSQDGTILMHDSGFHDTRMPQQKVLRIRWMVFPENFTSLFYVAFCI